MILPVMQQFQQMVQMLLGFVVVVGILSLVPVFLNAKGAGRKRRGGHGGKDNELDDYVRKVVVSPGQVQKPASGRLESPETYPFKVAAKRFFFSVMENNFYKALVPAAEQLGLAVFPKVGLNDLFIERDGAPKGQANYYEQMHVDYLLVSCKDFQPVAGIELNGPSHDSNEQQYRDRKKRAVFKAANIKLIQFYNQDQFVVEEIRQKLEDVLGAARGR